MPRVSRPRVNRVTRRVTASRRRQYSGSRYGPNVVRGRGGYWTDVKKRWSEGGGKHKSAFSGAGRLIGGSMAGGPGAAAGGLLGGLLNRALYAITGFGDYKIRSNVLLDETNGPPRVVNRGKEFVVRHREYIQDIYSASGANNGVSAFAVQGYNINPGNFSTFPWLSSIADKFEQYRIEGMLFEYKSLYSDAVVTANGSLGSIILATQYNAGAPAFGSKQVMENYEFAQSAKPSVSILHPIECARSQSVLSELYVRTGSVPGSEDIKTYDFADFYIASQGVPLGGNGAAVALGELWCTYQISLLKPRIPTASSTYVDSGFAYFGGITNNAGFQPFGTEPVPVNSIVRGDSSNLSVYLTANNTFTITLSSVPMTYMVNLNWYSMNPSATALWRGPAATLTNAQFVNSSSSGPYQNVRLPTALSISNGCNSQYFIRVPAATASAPTATVLITNSTFGADQANSVRFEGYFNAIPAI